MSWTDERIETLKKMWDSGMTATQIAEELGGVSRNAVIGKAHRLGLPARPSPVKPNESRTESPRAETPRPAPAPAAAAAAPEPRAAAPEPKPAAPTPEPRPVWGDVGLWRLFQAGDDRLPRQRGPTR